MPRAPKGRKRRRGVVFDRSVRHNIVRRPYYDYGITYTSWRGMMSRCYTKSDHAYPLYGGRGIKVCERWHEYKNFLADMGERLNGLSIHRINNDGDYCPKNCVWATNQQQILQR